MQSLQETADVLISFLPLICQQDPAGHFPAALSRSCPCMMTDSVSAVYSVCSDIQICSNYII